MKYHPVPAMSGFSRRTILGRAAVAAGAALSFGVGRIAAQDATPEPPRQDRGVVYGTIAGFDLLLDVARPPDRPEPRPAVVLVHGGGLIDSGPGRSTLHPVAIALA